MQATTFQIIFPNFAYDNLRYCNTHTIITILFLLYINDLPLNVLESNIVLFADDTNILVSGENLNTVQSRLNSVMKDIQTWFTLNSHWQYLSIPCRIKCQPYLRLYLKAEVFHTTLIQNF
jgi:hypothetical protein